MSRIDEALKRVVSQPPSTGRGPTRLADGNLRLAEELIIEQYPAESIASLRRHDVAPTRAEEMGGTLRTEGRPSARFKAADPNSKLVIAPDRRPVSLEQYRRLAATLH